MSDQWQVHKFGGSSLADAACFKHVCSILQNQSQSQNLNQPKKKAIVVSAMKGITDILLQITQFAKQSNLDYLKELKDLQQRLTDTIQALLPNNLQDQTQLISKFDNNFKDIRDILRATYLMHEYSQEILNHISGYGEFWSAQILHAYLTAMNLKANWLDTRKVLFVKQGETGPVIQWEKTKSTFNDWLTSNEIENCDYLVITGFIASTTNNIPTTLGRNGSDLTASIFGSLLKSESVTIWTDVDGILSADPKKVSQAVVLKNISYDEAMELAYFGAKVLHPGTIQPAQKDGIPITIRNTNNLNCPGTRIWFDNGEHQKTNSANNSINNHRLIKGLSIVDNVALVNVEGSNLIGVPSISERVFRCLCTVDVSVIMISQASSEHSICLAVKEHQSHLAKEALTEAFSSELTHGHMQSIEVIPSCSVLAAVGSRMREKVGIAARFFESIGNAGVNIKAISQGSSERNISVVIDEKDGSKALQAAHAAFYLSKQTISIGIIGSGLIGSTLIDQIKDESKHLLEELNIDLRVRGITTSKKMLLDEKLDLKHWKSDFESNSDTADLATFINFIHTDSLPHSVVVDCTASYDIAQHYVDWIKQGIHIITPNKRAGSGNMNFYKELRSYARQRNRHFLYEATVGAGLPIITTLRDLIHTGDKIEKIEGIFSGTLSFLFNTFNGDNKFSDVLKIAIDRGYTEPDPRDDLSGTDVVRKVMILAREMGVSIEEEDIQVDHLVPQHMQNNGTIEDFLNNLDQLDQIMADKMNKANVAGNVLRFVGCIDSIDKSNQGTVALKEYPKNHPFAHTQGSDNIIAFTTSRYNQTPLIIQGPGAGPAVTAGGVFADLLRLSTFLGAAT